MLDSVLEITQTVLSFLFSISIIYLVADFVTYNVALVLFKLLMPLKNKHGNTWYFVLPAAVPFALGFILDIYWNIVHFSPRLWIMNRSNKISGVRFFPNFSRVEGASTLHRITLTDRLQFILDTLPVNSLAYQYALDKRKVLNKYDPDHLTIERGRNEQS